MLFLPKYGTKGVCAAAEPAVSAATTTATARNREENGTRISITSESIIRGTSAGADDHPATCSLRPGDRRLLTETVHIERSVAILPLTQTCLQTPCSAFRARSTGLCPLRIASSRPQMDTNVILTSFAWLPNRTCPEDDPYGRGAAAGVAARRVHAAIQAGINDAFRGF